MHTTSTDLAPRFPARADPHPGRKRGRVGVASSLRRGSAAPDPATGGIVRYPSATLISRAPYSTVVHSADDVRTIGGFYDTQLAADGWSIVSRGVTDWGGSFTVAKGGNGASISISYTVNGSSIPISNWTG